MANKYWQGGAASIAQVNTFAFGGTWEANDLIRVAVGNRIYDFVAGSTSAATVVTNIVTAWLALDPTLFPEFAEITPSANSTTLTLTAATAGNSFVATLTPLETNAGAADAQTIEGAGTATTGTAATANSSPNSGSVATNWSGNALPADGDTIIFADTNVDLTLGLDFSDRNLNVIVEQSYTGKIGRPLMNPAGYLEYRATYLKIGTDDSPAQTVTIGQGTGAGSGRIKIDAGGSATTFVVHNTGTPAESNLPAVLLKGTDAANTLAVNKGSVGVAVLPYDESGAAEETATIATLNVGYVSNQAGDAAVEMGRGVTLTTINQSGGRLEINSAATTVNKTGGDLYLLRDGVTVGTINESGGNTFPIGTTTVDTWNVSETGHADYSRDMRAKTVTNRVNVYGSRAKFSDPNKCVSSLVIDLERCSSLVNLNLGNNISLSRGTVA